MYIGRSTADLSTTGSLSRQVDWRRQCIPHTVVLKSRNPDEQSLIAPYFCNHWHCRRCGDFFRNLWLPEIKSNISSFNLSYVYLISHEAAEGLSRKIRAARGKYISIISPFADHLLFLSNVRVSACFEFCETSDLLSFLDMYLYQFVSLQQRRHKVRLSQGLLSPHKKHHSGEKRKYTKIVLQKSPQEVVEALGKAGCKIKKAKIALPWLTSEESGNIYTVEFNKEGLEWVKKAVKNDKNKGKSEDGYE